MPLVKKVCESKNFPKDKIANFLRLTEFKDVDFCVDMVEKFDNDEISFKDMTQKLFSFSPF